MNLSSLSKSLILQIVALLSVGATVVLVSSEAPLVQVLTASSVAAVSVVLSILSSWSVANVFKKISRVSDAIRRGDFDQRLLLPHEKGDIKHAVDNINAMIDINDAFVRESALALVAASKGRFYRKIRPEGMRGMFSSAVARINESIDFMASSSAQRDEIVRSLHDQIGGTIKAAVAGDFSKRLTFERENDEFSQIAKQINDLLRTVNDGLSETGEVLAALAQKDLTRRVEGAYQGAFLRLKDDTNGVADKLTEVVSQLKETSGALKTATGEILAGANDLSERTVQQAATIEQTSATMEELTGAVLENADQADDANTESVLLSETAEKSGHVVAQATEAMDRITNSSAKISKVIGMIDDISFQTNLLALNASVEAARAGEAGKGFAVVAVEVRRLAQSASEASSEIKTLIEESVNDVESGGKFVTEVSTNLEQMIASIQKNSALVQGLARSSREQASSLEQIAQAVREMDRTTQHNAALVEETNAAIEQTDNQVVELDAIVEVFKTDVTPEEMAAREQARLKPERQHNERASDRLAHQSADAQSAAVEDGSAAA